MSKDLKFYFIATALLFLLVVWGLLLGGPAPLVLEALEGGLSLDRLRPGDLVALEGEWRYWPSSLHEDILDGTGAPAAVTLPHLWTGEEAEGFATYGMTLKGLDPAMTYGIFIKDEAMAYRLTVGGEVLIESGRVGRDKASYEPRLAAEWYAFKASEAGEADLVMEIANFDYFRGGFWLAPWWGPLTRSSTRPPSRS